MEGKFKVQSRRFCLFDSETEQSAFQFLHIYCTDVRSHSSAPKSNKQHLRDRALDLPFFFRYKHIPSLKNLPSPAPNESLPYWFQGNFAASFVLNFCLREFLLSACANRFELRCEPKRLMLLHYKICPCLLLFLIDKKERPPKGKLRERNPRKNKETNQVFQDNDNGYRMH